MQIDVFQALIAIAIHCMLILMTFLGGPADPAGPADPNDVIGRFVRVTVVCCSLTIHLHHKQRPRLVQ